MVYKYFESAEKVTGTVGSISLYHRNGKLINFNGLRDKLKIASPKKQSDDDDDNEGQGEEEDPPANIDKDDELDFYHTINITDFLM